MPVIDHIINPNYEVVTWFLSESKEELIDNVYLNDYRIRRYNQMRSKQQREYLGIRACLQVLNENLNVYYDEKGKPFLENAHHISITHSYDMVSVGLSKTCIGIDIEKKRDKKITNIASKFVSSEEQNWLQKKSNQTDYLHVIWGIKEGLYKLNGGNLWNFLNHYRVEDFELNPENEITCWIISHESSKHYKAFYKMLRNYYLIWVVEEDVSLDC